MFVQLANTVCTVAIPAARFAFTLTLFLGERGPQATGSVCTGTSDANPAAGWFARQKRFTSHRGRAGVRIPPNGISRFQPL